MRRSTLATLLFAIAVAHVVVGALLADADSATLLISGASAARRWMATQVLGASIAAYAVAGFATLGIAAPASWRTAGVAVGAASSILLTGLLRWHVG
jgi:hypothetical protein